MIPSYKAPYVSSNSCVCSLSKFFKMNNDVTNGNAKHMTRKNIMTHEMNYVPNLLNCKSVVLTRLTTSRMVYDSMIMRIDEFQYMLSLILF